MLRRADDLLSIRHMKDTQPTQGLHMVHSNDGHELYMLIKGDVSFAIDGHVYNLEPYDVLIISNQEIHRTIVHSDITYDRIYIYIDPYELSRYNLPAYDLLELFEKRKLGYDNKLPASVIKKAGIPELFIQLAQWNTSAAPERDLMMVTLLLQLIVRVKSVFYKENHAQKCKEDTNYNERVFEILNFISANLCRKVTLDELSERFSINKYYLCHLFKEVTGFTVLEYITYKRIQSARDMLHKGHTIEEAFERLGFENYSSFYRTFKKITFHSPREYIDRFIGK